MCYNCNNRNTRCKPHSFVDVTCSKSISWEDATVLLGLSSCNDIVPVEKPDDITNESNDRSFVGNLSQIGSSLTISLGGLQLVLTRQDTSTVIVSATSSQNTNLYVIRILHGPSAPDAWRKTISINPSGQIDSINVNTYIAVDYYVTYGSTKYHIVAGSDTDDLSVSWVEITNEFTVG